MKPEHFPPVVAKRRSARFGRRAPPYKMEDTTSDLTPPPSGTISGVNADTWHYGEDILLIEACKMSLNWADVSKQYFPSKSPFSCRTRYEQLMLRWQPADPFGMLDRSPLPRRVGFNENHTQLDSGYYGPFAQDSSEDLKLFSEDDLNWPSLPIGD